MKQASMFSLNPRSSRKLYDNKKYIDEPEDTEFKKQS